VTVIASVPAGRADVVSVAVLVRLPVVVRVAVPIAVDPFTNVTDPVGAAEVPVSVAVNVTACPTYGEGFEDPTAIVVLEDPDVLHVYVTIEYGASVSPPDPQL
jgi:hypothetical protein